MSHAPPPGPPPGQRRDSMDDAVPDEPPPAYEAVSRTDPVVQAGPSRMDFSGPPPLPDRFQNLHPTPTGGYSIPGVGTGYAADGPSHSDGYGSSHGSGYTSPSPSRPPPPPRHPSATPHSPTAAPLSPSATGGGEYAPTEHPVPGRPLLHAGQLLVYPKGYYCSKCQNTGYKNGDARHPCTADWRKYGKDYTGAVAASFAVAPRPGSNPTTVAATNFQRPLPGPSGNHAGHGHGQHGHGQGQGWGGGYPGQYRPPPPQQHYQPMVRPHMYAPPSGALVVQPGDPRIGGQLCFRCGGSGRETSLFLFDDGPCWQCRGVGRVF